MKNKGEEIARILLKIGAVSINTENFFTYASGIKSPIYTDCRRIISYPKEREKIIETLVQETKQLKCIEYIAAVESAGIPHVSMVAQKLNLPMIYVRPKKKEHGLGKRVEGYLEPEKNVLLIEDHISTGRGSLSCIDTIREEGGNINYCLAIFTYNLDDAIEKFRKKNVELRTLSNIYILLDVANYDRLINHKQQEIVYSWLREHGGKMPYTSSK